MKIKRPLLAFFVLLAILTAGGLIASNADAHGWHWTKCRNGDRWIRGHQGVNWYGPWHNSCNGVWEIWEYYNVSTVWK